MTLPAAPDDQRTGPQTDQERELLALSRDLDEADWALLWSAALAGRVWPVPELIPEEGSAQDEALTPSSSRARGIRSGPAFFMIRAAQEMDGRSVIIARPSHGHVSRGGGDQSHG